MQVYGVDLAEWYAAGRWVALLDYIDGLPAACRLNEAIANDPEAADELAKLPKPEGEWSPRVSEFGLEHQMLREIIQRLDGILQASVVQTGNKAPQIEPFPTPKTEIQRAIERAEKAWASDFVQQFGFDAADI